MAQVVLARKPAGTSSAAGWQMEANTVGSRLPSSTACGSCRSATTTASWCAVATCFGTQQTGGSACTPQRCIPCKAVSQSVVKHTSTQ